MYLLCRVGGGVNTQRLMIYESIGHCIIPVHSWVVRGQKSPIDTRKSQHVALHIDDATLAALKGFNHTLWDGVVDIIVHRPSCKEVQVGENLAVKWLKKTMRGGTRTPYQGSRPPQVLSSSGRPGRISHCLQKENK
jgi:hypothetical protein